MPPPGQAQRAESKFIVFENFEKMNTQSVRQALSEKELAWLENLQPIAGNNLATVPGPNSSIGTLQETITAQYFASIGGSDYIISFTSIGSGWATNLSNATNTRFAAPGSFTNPDMTVWQAAYILINDPTAGYSAWNGTIFVRRGGVSPVLAVTASGSGYTSVPTVAITGGSGSGATAVATIGTPQVSSITTTNGGSQYTTIPGVVFAGGGGSGAAATVNAIDPRGLTSIYVTNQGAYSNAFNLPPTVSFSGGGGSGAAAVATTAFNGSAFVVTGVTITAAGSNYSSPPTITFTGGSVLTTPAATCTVGDGGIRGITLTNPGSGYTSAPTISFSGGGGGSGATAFATIGGGGVNTLVLTNPGGGYLPSDVLTLTISGGGGSGATGTAHVWPFVTAGTTLAVFGGRVWLGSVRLIQYSGTQGFDDFAAANASASFNINDADLVHAVTALRNLNNYLFIFGDQSVKQIGAISLNAAGTVTLFTVLTLSSDQGTIYPRSCCSFNRITMFVNSNGVYAVLGASVQKISDDLDGIFRAIDFSQPPVASIVDINDIHNIMFLVRYVDPLTTTRSLMLAFNGKKWFTLSQAGPLVSVVATSTLASGKITTYGSSGQDLTALFSNPAIPVNFKLTTALTHHGNAVQRKKLLAAGFVLTLTATSSTIGVIYETENASVFKTFTLGAGSYVLGGHSGVGGSGRYLGMTFGGTVAGLTFTNAALEYEETSVWT
jgi:hypothetical protein